MIDCREAVARMWAYLSRGLGEKDVAQLEEHLGVCQRCCGELEFSRQLQDKLAQSGSASMPAPIRRRVEELLRAAEPGAGEPS